MSPVRRLATLALLLAVLAPDARWVRAAEPGWDAAPLARFFDDHPWVARDLQRDPTLANDARYLDAHRSLREFLVGHPDVGRALRDDPHGALRRAHAVERAARARRELDPAELAHLDRFLQDHPEVRHDLQSNAALVNDRSYLADHPSFRDFLRDHPTLRQEFQDNPWAFMRHGERRTRSNERPVPSPRP